MNILFYLASVKLEIVKKRDFSSVSRNFYQKNPVEKPAMNVLIQGS